MKTKAIFAALILAFGAGLFNTVHAQDRDDRDWRYRDHDRDRDQSWRYARLVGPFENEAEVLRCLDLSEDQRREAWRLLKRASWQTTQALRNGVQDARDNVDRGEAYRRFESIDRDYHRNLTRILGRDEERAYDERWRDFQADHLDYLAWDVVAARKIVNGFHLHGRERDDFGDLNRHVDDALRDAYQDYRRERRERGEGRELSERMRDINGHYLGDLRQLLDG